MRQPLGQLFADVRRVDRGQDAGDLVAAAEALGAGLTAAETSGLVCAQLLCAGKLAVLYAMRGELRLAERASLWSARRGDRQQLPGFWEWVNILLFTRARDRTPPQRQMMRAASRRHLLRAGGVVVVLAVAALAGISWTTAASELWVAGQRAMPPWARGRMNATHIMLTQGGMALGGLVWGGSAASLGVSFTLLAAAALLLSSLALAFPLSIDFTGKLNFDPAVTATYYHNMLHAPHPEDGPVAITIDFQIAPVNRARFLELMRAVRLMHLRNGAFSWRLD